MRRISLFLFLIISATAAGLYAGNLWKPEKQSAPDLAAEPDSPSSSTTDFVRLNNQFIIPILSGDRVAALVVLSLSLEITPGQSEYIYLREPKLRDAFLQVLFDHANTGGFSGAFTDTTNLVQLRRSLLGEARLVLGEVVQNVLITEIARQDS